MSLKLSTLVLFAIAATYIILMAATEISRVSSYASEKNSCPLEKVSFIERTSKGRQEYIDLNVCGKRCRYYSAGVIPVSLLSGENINACSK